MSDFSAFLSENGGVRFMASILLLLSLPEKTAGPKWCFLGYQAVDVLDVLPDAQRHLLGDSTLRLPSRCREKRLTPPYRPRDPAWPAPPD